MCEITKTLETLLDPSNPEDKKFLLLAKLIDDKTSSIMKKVSEMDTALTSLAKERENCPVFKGNNTSDFLMFVLRYYPKIFVTICICIGYILTTLGEGAVVKILSLF